MYVKNIMRTNITTATLNETIQDVVQRMRQEHRRMLPVVDDLGVVHGEVSTASILQHIIPEYLATGDLIDISYAPDINFLTKHYQQVMQKTVKEIMHDKPLLVRESSSILSVASALLKVSTHGYALVVNQDNVLLGILSSGDILNRLHSRLEV